MGVSSKLDRVPFYPYYVFKDLVGFFAFFFILSIFVFFFPNALGHPDNSIPANPMQTPISIVPEFYLLPFYAILRAIPNKLLGVVAMLASILILLLLPFLESSRVRSSAFRPFMRFSFWLFVVNFLLLMWIGSNHPEPPYILLGQLCTAFYFAYFLILVPLLGLIENTLSDLGTNYSSTPSNSQKFPLFYLFFTLKSKEFHRWVFQRNYVDWKTWEDLPWKNPFTILNNWIFPRSFSLL